MAWKISGTGISRCSSALGRSLAFATALSLASSPAAAAPSRSKSRASAASAGVRPTGKAAPGAASVRAASATPASLKARAKPKPKAVPPETTEPPRAPPAPTPAEAAVAVSGAKPAADVVKTEEARAGEKTYTFGAQEVEGRLKSPTDPLLPAPRASPVRPGAARSSLVLARARRHAATSGAPVNSDAS